MQPLSKTKRRFYLYGLIAVFVLCLPLVMLYANGYRFKSGAGFVRTGGLIISVSESGGTVSVNGKDVGTSGFLRHNFYVDDLTPGKYQILVTREGDLPWHRTLVVEQELVTDAQSFLVPKEITSVLLVDSAKAPLSTTTITHATYESYRTAFLPSKATSTQNVVPHNPSSEVLTVEDGDVLVLWTDAGTMPPSRYCSRPSFCSAVIPVEDGKQHATRAEFFAGGVVYTTKEGGVFLAEIDVRPEPLTVPLYPVRGADFRIVAGHLIVKDGTALYEITEL
ncbi:hypothetical protein HY971_01885 [Candidatus Kaiserbacteria bacterium]|nr:hypothetical protein [Candidatus Kaiserbacteria bacterium]